MAEGALLLSAALQIVTGALYAYIGHVTSRRRIGGESQLAVDLFSVWWYGLGAVTAAGALPRVLAWAGVADVALYLTLTHLTLLGLCVALWALLYYLVYIFTGNRRWLLPLAGFYAVYYVALLYWLSMRRAVGVSASGWSVQLEYATAPPPVATAVLTVLLVLPPLLGAIGYARLFFRVHDRTQRYRIGIVSFTIIAWFGSALAAFATGLSSDPSWQAVSRVIGLTAALLIYAAYRPPGWVQRRWGVRAIDETRAA